MGRIPKEPSIEKQNGNNETTEGLSWPSAVDFAKIKSEGKIANDVCLRHMTDMAETGLRLTDAELTPMSAVTSITKDAITVSAEKSAVLGSLPGMECVRHSAEFNVNAQTMFDIYVRLNYTDAIDAFTYLVEQVEEINAGPRFQWAHVVYTADKLTLPLLAHRSFVTFDFCDAKNLMLVSRSCLHPNRRGSDVHEGVARSIFEAGSLSHPAISAVLLSARHSSGTQQVSCGAVPV